MSGNIQSLALARPKKNSKSEDELKQIVKQDHVLENGGSKAVTDKEEHKQELEEQNIPRSESQSINLKESSNERNAGENERDGGENERDGDEKGESEKVCEDGSEVDLEKPSNILENIPVWLKELDEMEMFSTPRAVEILKGIANYHWQNADIREEISSIVDQNGGAGIFLKILKSLSKQGLFKSNSVWYPANYCYNVVWNLSDGSSGLALSLGKCGMISLCATNIAHKPYIDHLNRKNILFLVKASLSILHNLSKVESNRHRFRDEGLVDMLMPYTSTDQKYLKALCMLILANIIDEDQESLLDEKGTIEFLIKLLKEAQESEDRRAQGLSCSELANGLGRLAVNDANKSKIQSANGLPPFINMLDSEDILEQEAATQALWSLSFDSSICTLLSTNDKALNSLKALQSSESKTVEMSAKGTMWMLRQARKSLEDESSVNGKKRGRPKSSRQSSLRRIHVMISYQWNSQRTVLKIRDALVAAGYTVWVDVDKMCGSTLQAMAEAVEKAAAVIVCVSEGYKMSPNCRTEAEYAYQLQKWIIPLMMDMYYEPDGWLGLILGAKYYMDFSGVTPFEDSAQKLIKELDSSKSSFDAPDSVFDEESIEPVITKSSEFTCNSSIGIMNWTEEDVLTWLSDHQLEKYKAAFEECNGKLLQRLKALRQEAPEFFYKSLKEDLGINKLFDILRFTEALEGIR
ncbi:hypothetical protein HOLleu_19825 [Holothuria leucospilota]|uniref:ADP-ribosyl cyclase/cyclic ADP-ribose hydrolase n=1 Tax=Holothuria leucospilota TaxID=206669 RepID=A0A9Q1C056_HOLLE|nr:hypothetical protein HOLleu_19825 [Holothuria leucospilota]